MCGHVKFIICDRGKWLSVVGGMDDLKAKRTNMCSRDNVASVMYYVVYSLSGNVGLNSHSDMSGVHICLKYK